MDAVDFGLFTFRFYLFTKHLQTSVACIAHTPWLTVATEVPIIGRQIADNSVYLRISLACDLLALVYWSLKIEHSQLKDVDQIFWFEARVKGILLQVRETLCLYMINAFCQQLQESVGLCDYKKFHAAGFIQQELFTFLLHFDNLVFLSQRK